MHILIYKDNINKLVNTLDMEQSHNQPKMQGKQSEDVYKKFWKRGKQCRGSSKKRGGKEP